MGLWYDKFCDQYDDSWSLGSPQKLAWVKNATLNPVGDEDLLEERTLRTLDLAQDCGGACRVFSTQWRFVSGLGRNHPIESGFLWHHTLGVPYLAGSSIKGVFRAWLSDPAKHGFVLEGGLWSISFLDALPILPVSMEADVLTPHYAGWEEERVPGDWLDPKPVPFLAVAADTPFLFSVVPAKKNDPQLVSNAMDFLQSALDDEGAGAKTDVGYGWFLADEKRSAELKDKVEAAERERRRLAEDRALMATPEGRFLIELRDLSEGDILDLVRRYLEKNELDDSGERKAFARAVLRKGLVKEYWLRGRSREAETRTGKPKLKARGRLVVEIAAPPQ